MYGPGGRYHQPPPNYQYPGRQEYGGGAPSVGTPPSLDPRYRRQHEMSYAPPSGAPPQQYNAGSAALQMPQAPSNAPFHYAYSNCSGRRKALLIGINYFHTRNELKGCINDVKNMRRFLKERYGYKDDDMVILTDDQHNPRGIPTMQNIITAMQWLVRGAQQNDSLVFHYSGHGGSVPDLDGDEGQSLPQS